MSDQPDQTPEPNSDPISEVPQGGYVPQQDQPAPQSAGVVPVAYPPATGQLGVRRSVGTVILLSIVTCGVWTVVWSYQTGDELQKFRGKGLGGLVYLLITFFVSPVTMFLLAGEVEDAYHDMGWESPVQLLDGLWFLLPLAGPIVWYVKVQEAINEYWTLQGQTNEPGL